MRTEAAAQKGDIVDRHILDWVREFPDMDVATEGLVERIAKLARYFERSLGETASEFGLTIQDWELLGALRRVGPPYRLSPSKLAQDLMLSSGAMTARLDRLERARLVRRRPDPDDRRAVRVELTDKGSKTWGAAVDVQAAKERYIAASLNEKEKALLNDLLRRLMRTFEETAGPPPPRSEVLEAYGPGKEQAGRRRRS
ncbi:MAG: MarR family transcriptional regulator [Actinobacteria bacterium]|nr:MAG: MarR family transcriptional regulator [Actinomycetota bacterium]